ncbi:cell division protein FtsL [Kitasatospora gansuensis]|uniref:Cell division protein FtsL n=1 Tax=Kitasatospora gansuensis TaxID=258050 RepID=A0A7W7SBS8_9ACTN|nr:cell division protein FtsL [Kitasatospora gansuensis]
MSGLEIVFTGLLVLVAVLVTWFAIFAVMKLYQGQR